MPKHPIYGVLLTQEAQAVMGKVHPQTAPALRLLEQEGFRYQGYIDIFDGGPTVEAPLSDIRSIRESRLLQAKRGATKTVATNGTHYLVANTQLLNYRCGVAELSPGADAVELPPALAKVLLLKSGDPVRIVAL
jgi:arginine N-succinyltransferase